MAADMADLRTGFNQIKGEADQFGQTCGKAFDFAKNALITLGVTASVGVFVNSVKSAIDYADSLNDLSQKTGITVQTLGGLEYAAKQSGADLDAVAKGAQKLAQLMAEAAGGNDKASATLATFGINAKNADGTLLSLDEALFTVADRFESYKDGPEKAAAAQELMSKGGKDLIPLLNMGGDALRAAVEEYKKYGGVTTETAQRADAFNDTMEKINLMQGAFTRSLTAALLPTLQVLADIFVDVKGKGSDFGGVIDIVVGTVKGFALAGLGVVAAFQAAGQAIAGTGLAMLRFIEGDYKGAWNALKDGVADAAGTLSTMVDRMTSVWNAGGDSMVASAKKNGPEASAPIVKASKDSKDAVEDYATALGDLQKKISDATIALTGQTSETSNYDTAVLKVTADLEAGKIIRNEAITAYLDTAAALDKAKVAQGIYNDTLKDAAAFAADAKKEREAYDDQLVKAKAATDALITSMQGQNAQLVAETAAIGMTVSERIDHNAQLEREKILRMDIAPEQAAMLTNLVNERAGLEKVKAGAEQAYGEWKNRIADVQSVASNFILDVVEGGWKKAFGNLWTYFKDRALQAFADIAAQKIAVSLVGTFAAGGAGANPLGGGGGILDTLTSAGSAFSSLSNIFTTGTSLMTAAGTAFATSSAGAALGLSELAVGAGAAAEVGAAAAGAGLAITEAGIALASMVPVVGWIAAAAIAAYVIFGKEGGGPKSGGFATTGATPGITGTDNSGRWMTPNQSDADLTKALNQVSGNFDKLLAAFGGTGTATFAQGFDTDPKGSAQNNVHTGVWVNGQQVFNRKTRTRARAMTRFSPSSKRNPCERSWRRYKPPSCRRWLEATCSRSMCRRPR